MAKFRKGQRVRATKELLDQLPYLASRDGIVVGFPGKDLLRIRFDGLRQPQTYHVSFWIPVRRRP